MKNAKNAFAVVALMIAAVVLTVPARAQDNVSANAKKAAAKPPKATLNAVLDQWNDIGRKLIAMAEDFPEDKYDYKPTPAQQTFGQRLAHAAGANYFLTNAVLGQKPPSMESANPDQYKTKAEVVAFVKKSFADGAAAMKLGGAAGMSKIVTDPFENERVKVSDFAYGFVEHSGEIYGQLTVYYRLSGLIPPESRPKK